MTGAAFLILLLLRVPIGFVLLGSSIVFIFASGNLRLLAATPQILFNGLEVYGLLAIPLFIFLGEIMNEGGITGRLITAARVWLRRVPNELSFVSLFSNLMLASILGSATAQIAVMSRIMVPSMEEAGYPRPYAAAITAAGGLLGPIIPPSMAFIMYGVVSQVSIGRLFIGGIIPGLLLFTFMCVYIALRGSKAAGVEPVATQEAGGGRWHATRNALLSLSIPAIIVGGIAFGIVTPTESAALAIFAAILLGALVFGELKWRSIPGILERTTVNSALVFFLIVSANIFGFVLIYNQIPNQIAAVVQGFTQNPTVFLVLVFLLLVLVGIVLDAFAALIILVPILLPMAQNSYGIDPIHFGVVVCLTLMLGLLTPPVGAGLYVAAATSRVEIMSLSRALLPFFLIAALVILVVIFFPATVQVLL
ncbi:MAG: TRAP transporter large permease [Gammaproteobacteria bacterium]|nr:TRAP transporter large permease [Gammaproteobacteria bacterium]